VARRYGCKLVAVEEQPVDHYYVPKAEVQRDVYIPRVFSEVVRGESLYVSVPKMKTNLYTASRWVSKTPWARSPATCATATTAGRLKRSLWICYTCLNRI
jgi:hypothetical protein